LAVTSGKRVRSSPRQAYLRLGRCIAAKSRIRKYRLAHKFDCRAKISVRGEFRCLWLPSNPNQLGFYDLVGNCAQMLWPEPGSTQVLSAGGNWKICEQKQFSAKMRWSDLENEHGRNRWSGFRIGKEIVPKSETSQK